jgi:hypothetical protein
MDVKKKLTIFSLVAICLLGSTFFFVHDSLSATTETGMLKILNLKVKIKEKKITITWDTNRAASTQVGYRTKENLVGATSESNTYPRVKKHKAEFIVPNDCTRYDYWVRSQDADGMIRIIAANSFTTTSCKPVDVAAATTSLYVNPDPVAGVAYMKDALVIGDGSGVTTNRRVTLWFNVENAKEMAISNSSGFEGVSFERFRQGASWVLPPGYGEKVVFARFRIQGLRTTDAMQKIVLKPEPALPASQQVAQPSSKSTPQTKPTSSTSNSKSTPSIAVVNKVEEKENIVPLKSCSLTHRKPYSYPGNSSVYYITENCTRQLFTNESMYLTYFSSWTDVQTVDKKKLDAIPLEKGAMPKGHLYNPTQNVLVKTLTKPDVYLIEHQTKHKIVDQKAFTTLGYKTEWIEYVSDSFIDANSMGTQLTASSKHPAGTLIKYPGRPEVYIIESYPYNSDGVIKRYIPDEKVFMKNGFDTNRIIVIQPSETYQEGKPLT